MKLVSSHTMRSLLDRFGALAAMICALHCALVPLALAAIPALTLALYQFNSPLHDVAQWMLLSHSFERIFAALSLSLCAMSLLIGWRRHGQLWAFLPWSLALILLGLGTLTSLAFVPIWHALFLVSGGTAVGVAHLLNLRLARLEPKIAQPRAQGPVIATVKPGL